MKARHSMDPHTSASRARPGPDGRRGAALMIAIIVLTALMLLAIPFAAFMRRQHAAGTQALHSARAESGEAGALSHAQAALGLGQPGAENEGNPFPYDNPQVDTLWEFRVTLRTQVAGGGFGTGTVSFAVDDALGLPNDDDDETIDGYIRVDNEWMAYSDLTGLTSASTGATVHVDLGHRGLFGTAEAPHAAGAIVSFFPDAELWTLDVEDPQSKININTAPYRVIRNLLAYVGIGPAPGSPPSTRQQAIATAIVEHRARYVQWRDWDDGIDNVPYYTYADTPFQNVDMLKSISLARDETTGTFIFDPANPPLSAEEFDLLRPHITTNSGYESGAVAWISPGALESDIASGALPTDDPSDPSGNTTSRFVANLPDARSVGVGSLVRLEWTDPVLSPYEHQAAYRTVLAKNGCGRPITLAQTYNSGLVDPAPDLVLQWAPGFVGASASTPCYIKIDDEWILYTGVMVDDDADPTTLTLTGCEGGKFGTNRNVDHVRGIASVDADVVSWKVLGTPSDLPPLIDELPLDFLPTDVIVQVQNRHGVNVNTCTDPVVLQAIFYDVDRYGTDPVGTGAADTIWNGLLQHTSAEAATPYTFFDGGENWFDGDGSSTPEAELAEFFATADTRLATNHDYLTVPLQFNSGALLGLGSLAVADDRAGTPVAQSPNTARLARLFDVLPPLTESIWQWRSQKEFYEHIRATGGGKNVMTTPLNEGLVPPDTAVAFAVYADTTPTTGTVMPALDELYPSDFTTLLEGLHEWTPDFTLDYSAAGDLYVSADTPGFDNTTAQGIADVHLTYNNNYANQPRQRHIEADSFHTTIQPFAVEFWIRPGDDAATKQLVLDLGQDATPDSYSALNQVRIYLENGRMVLRMDEPIHDEAACCAGYVEAISSLPLAFEPNVWHHVAVAAVGTFREEMVMFIDGIYDRDMEWTYHYRDSSGTPPPADESQVREGTFLPLAAEIPNGLYQLAVNAPAGSGAVQLVDVTGLPSPSGMIVIGGAGYPYEYTAVDAATRVLTLASALGEGHLAGDAVAFMIPLARTVHHTESYTLPADSVVFRSHNEIAPPNGSYELDAGATPYTVGSVATTATFPEYIWLGVEPTEFPLAIGPLQRADRWKGFVYHPNHIATSTGVLSGTLPTGDLGNDLSIGASRDDSAPFLGELDEVRVSALPLALTTAGWGSGSAAASVQEWEWAQDLTGWWRVSTFPGVRFDMASVAPAWPPLHQDGGYFVVADTPAARDTHILYSYQRYDPATGQFSGIRHVSDDLAPRASSGLVADHPELHRIIPLNFITSTRLWAAFAPADDHIQVVDASQFPRQGYVRIDDEIIGYSGKDTSVAPHLLLRPTSAAGGSPYPRGAYGTTEADHLAGAVVRHLPVRHPDRYRAEQTAGTWDVHTTYDDPPQPQTPQLDAQMCMVSFPIYRAGKLKTVSWEFKNPLKDNQKVAVLVRIDDAVPWNANPYDDDAEDVAVFGSQNPETSVDLLWGTMSADPDPDGELTIYKWIDPGAGTYGYPTATSKVEVRFYFDLSGTHPYNQSYDSTRPTPIMSDGWQNMIEIDRVQIEMEAESGIY